VAFYLGYLNLEGLLQLDNNDSQLAETSNDMQLISDGSLIESVRYVQNLVAAVRFLEYSAGHGNSQAQVFLGGITFFTKMLL
jgi:hypothetical protein